MRHILFILLLSTTAGAQTVAQCLMPESSELEIFFEDVSDEVLCFVGCAMQLNTMGVDVGMYCSDWTFGNGGMASTTSGEYAITCYNEPGIYTATLTLYCCENPSEFIMVSQVIDVTCGWEDEEILGCTYEQAINFSPNANLDDGSCEYFCPNDCLGDVTGDASVTIEDILVILSQFGLICE